MRVPRPPDEPPVTFTDRQIAQYHLGRLLGDDANDPVALGVFIERPAVALTEGTTGASCACGYGRPTVRPKAKRRPRCGSTASCPAVATCSRSPRVTPRMGLIRRSHKQ